MAVVVVFLAVAVAELLWPRAAATALTRRRWIANFAVFGLGIALVMLPASVVAIWSVGGPADWLGMPAWLGIVVGVVVLDALTYLLHRLYHGVGPLWRFHAVHHSDPELDVTTTLRQHPVATVLTVGSSAAAVALLGVPAVCYAAFRVLDMAVQSLAHANLRLPPRLMAGLGWVFVTPAFHRIHHSPWMPETNSNYGEIFSVWDRLLGTARQRASGDVRSPEFGLEAFREARFQTSGAVLAQPFRAQPPAMPRRPAAASSPAAR